MEDRPDNKGSAGVSSGVRVIVDAQGGDCAPAAPVRGAVLAAERFPDTRILLAGPSDMIGAELEKLPAIPPNVGIVQASQKIDMNESPVSALREKRDSSISVGIAMVAARDADAFVSAGNTGAVVAASSLVLRLIKGVQRPGIAIPMLVIDHPVVVIDVGANIQCKPTHLLQYGIMATVFARDILELDNPRVGLLNVGEEARKGSNLLKDGFDLLSAADLNFIGNVEAKDMFEGACDIVVCEGIAGNILLKTSEAVVSKLFNYLSVEFRRKWYRKLGYALCRAVYSPIKRCSDYSEYGGAPLLGVDGVTIIAHGRSDPKAIASAVREARNFLELKVNDKIGEAVRAGTPPGNGPDASVRQGIRAAGT